MTVDGAHYVCEAGHRHREHDGYVDLRRDDLDEVTRRTAESFGYEWTAFEANNDEDESFWRRHSSDLDLSGMGDALAIDAGCGKGRYTRFMAPHVGRMVALDASDATAVAARNMASLANVAVVRADLRDIPFEESAFDLVSSIGVLHHLADPHDGFLRLTRLLAPGGTMFLYLYSRSGSPGLRSTGLAAATAIRRLTVRVPHRALRALSVPVAALLWLTLVVPGALGDRFRIRRLSSLPMHTYRGKPFRSLWLDTFDRLSAPLEHRYLWSELEPWFDEAGLEVVAVRDDAGFYVVARKRS